MRMFSLPLLYYDSDYYLSSLFPIYLEWRTDINWNYTVLARSRVIVPIRNSFAHNLHCRSLCRKLHLRMMWKRTNENRKTITPYFRVRELQCPFGDERNGHRAVDPQYFSPITNRSPRFRLIYVRTLLFSSCTCLLVKSIPTRIGEEKG